MKVKNIVLLLALGFILSGCAAAVDPVSWYDPTPRYGTYYGRDAYGRPYYERMRRDHDKHRGHYGGWMGHPGGGYIPGPRNMQRIIPPNPGSRYGGGGGVSEEGARFRHRWVYPRQERQRRR